MRSIPVGSIIVLLLTPVMALAQDTPTAPVPVTYTVDLSPLFSQVVWPILSAVALALAGWIGNIARKHFGEKTGEVVQARLAEAMSEGLKLAQVQVKNSDIEKIETQSQILAGAANYVSAHAGDTLEKLGVTPQLLDEKLSALLAPAVMVAAAQPGTVSVATAATQADPAIATAPILKEDA